MIFTSRRLMPFYDSKGIKLGYFMHCLVCYALKTFEY